MASDNWPTYVILAIYIVLTCLVTFVAKKKNSDPDDTNSHVSKHFLGSKSMGPVLLVFTTFASVFSGYTVVGVPNEAGNVGFFAVRWTGLIIAVGCSMLWLFPRLRRLSIVRNYESPGDFINDRFRSPALSVLVAVLMCFPQIIYIGIQLFSLGTSLEDLTDGELGFYWVVVVCAIIMLIFEVLGGMRSVAYTDAVEAVVMVTIFITIPTMLGVYYGGFVGQVNNSEDLTISCDNSFDDDTNGCINYISYDIEDEEVTTYESGDLGMASTTMPGAMTELTEYYLRSPSSLTTLNYVLFICAGLSSAIQPHIMQRAFIAQSDSHVRIMMMAVFAAPFIANTPGVLTGITKISNQWDGDTFPSMLSEFRDRGGFAAFVSYITLLAAIAGIMSTADSSLIGISNTISVDVFKNHLLSSSSDTKIVHVGKCVSMVTMALCLGFSCWLYNTDEDYGSVFTIQQGFIWQSVPAFVFGLYTDLSGKAVLTGTSTGLVTSIILISVIFSNDRAHDPLPLVDKSWSTFLAIFLNVTISLFSHFVIFTDEKQESSDDNAANEDTTKQLTIDRIRKIMNGISEPVTKWYGALVWIALAMPLIAAFHWIGDVDPDLIEEYGKDNAKEIMFNGEIRNVIAGLPDWAFATFWWYAVGAILGIVATAQWDVDSGFKHMKGAHVSDKSTEVTNMARKKESIQSDTAATAGATENVDDVE